MSDLSDVTLAVLAGGAGTRMGIAKSLLQIDGRPILQSLHQRLDWPGPTLLVTAPGREHPPGWELFDREAPDPVADQGPLRGILTAMENITTSRLVVIAVDMPNLTQPVLHWLSNALVDDAEGVMIRNVRTGHIEPLPAAFHIKAAVLVRRQLEKGERSLKGLVDSGKIRVTSPPPDWPESLWTNLNTPADLQQLNR